jgi:predicted metal-dependent peptidase
VAIDTSGSIGEEELKIFLSEVKGIMESYDDDKISV